MKKIVFGTLASLLVFALLAGCGGAQAQTSTSQNTTGLNVVATIFPHYDFARAVCGDEANITMLLKPGAESHSFDPSPADVITIQNADVFIYTGGHADAWVDTILSSINTENMLILRMIDYVNVVEEDMLGQEHDEHEHEDHDHEDHETESLPHEDHEETTTHNDEHIWTSPINAKLMVSAIAEALENAGYDKNGTFNQNAKNYLAKLDALDETFREIVSTAKRNIIVFGDRFPFRYFTDEYGLTYYAAFPGCSTDSNPSAGTVASLIDIARENELPYIYTIELSTGSIARVICEEAGCESLTLESCQTLTKNQFEDGETYITLMQKNADALRKGLN